MRMLLCLALMCAVACQESKSTLPKKTQSSPPLSDEEIQRRVRENKKTEDEERKRAEQGQQKDMAEALAEPGMESAKIPVNPGLFMPFKERPSTPADIETRQRMMNALWNTPLGQMLWYYLFNDESKLQQPSMSRQFVRRIFAASSQVSTRISALHLLVSDLYVRDLMTQEAGYRISLLENDIFQENEKLNSETKNWIVYQAAAFFIFSLPFGSPIVREEAMKLY